MKTTFANPVIPGFYPDPSVCRVGEDYYLVTSSFEYFPGVPIFHSRDLIHWRQIGHCLTRTSQLQLMPTRDAHSNFEWIPGYGQGIYAPTIRYHNGLFTMVTTNVTLGRHLYVWTDDPAGEWSDPIWVDVPKIGSSIDPSLFFDDDGKVYFTCQGAEPRGIHQFEIDLATGKPLSETRYIWEGACGKDPEGPHLYKIRGQYYLLVAEGGTEYGHLEAIGRSDSPWGPFEKCPHNPILSHRSQRSPIQATGHAELIEDHQGRWWCFCLGIRPNGYPPAHHLGRETFLAPVTWTADGWPIVGDGGRVALQMEAQCLPPHLWDDQEAVDDFDAPQLRLDWNFLLYPPAERWSLTERAGGLALHGTAKTLDDYDPPTFIGRRQRHLNCHVSTLLDFEPLQDGEEAGLTVFMNPRHHYEIAVSRLDGQRCVIVRRRIGSLAAVVARSPIESGPITLSIDAESDRYRFSYALRHAPPTLIAEGETRYLATEVAGGFTGVYFGLYATGNGRVCLAPAYSEWFKYVPDPG